MSNSCTYFQTKSGRRRRRRKEGEVKANPVAFMLCIVLLQRPVVLSKGHIAKRWGGRSWSQYAIVAGYSCCTRKTVHDVLLCQPVASCRKACVLLCFVDPILGNRYGPGVIP